MFNKYIFILSLVLSISMQSNAFGNDSIKLELVLTPRTNDVIFGEIYWADIDIKNNGNEPITICNCNIFGTNYIRELGNPSAKLVEDTFWTDEAPNEKDIYTVPPGGSIYIGATGLDKNYLCNPGKWSYRYRNEFKSVKTPDGGNSWAGVLDSNTLEINVIKK